MKVSPVFYPGINCIDILPISYAKHLDREIELIFANSWNFRFDPNIAEFGHCFGVEETNLTVDQYTQLGFKREFFPVEDFTTFIRFLKESFKNQTPIGIFIDSFYCPWHVRFQIDHGSHYVLGFDINEQNEIICIDPGFNKQGVEKLPLEFLEKGYEYYFTLENVGCPNPSDLFKSYVESIDKLKSLNIPTKIEQFSRYFDEKFDYETECKDIL